MGPPDFSTQDEPSHIHNAAVLRDYTSVPVYQQYYQRRFTLTGNVITQPLVLLLLSVLPTSAAACKAVSVIVVAAFPLAFAWLLSAFTRHTGAFTLLASPCALSYGVVLLRFALG